MTHSPPMPEACASGSVAMQVRTDQLQLLFRQSFLATFGSVGGALALSWLQRDLGLLGLSFHDARRHRSGAAAHNAGAAHWL